MTLEEAQRDIRRAYGCGGLGAIISGLVWLLAAGVTQVSGIRTGFIILFLGGMLIFPLGLLISRLLLRWPPEAPGNTLGRTALESTIAMIGLFFAAWLFVDIRPDYVFPLAAMAVGLHYFAFRTVYGDVAYWLLGGMITAAGLAGIYGVLPSATAVALTVGVIEIVFGIVLTRRSLAAQRP